MTGLLQRQLRIMLEFAALHANYMFINKMITRLLTRNKLIEKCDIQVVIKIFAVIMITIVHTQIVH